METVTNWLVQLYQPDTESAKWRLILRCLGVEATPVRDEVRLSNLLLEGDPGLVIIDRNLLGESFATLGSACSWWIERGGGIALSGKSGLWPLPQTFLETVTDISERDPFVINALLKQYLSGYSRNHPRLEIRLPGLFALGQGSGSQICEIMNLSPGGAFIRTIHALPEHGAELLVSIPLMGMRKEVELAGSVIRHVTPCEENNFLQGIGISFDAKKVEPILADLNGYVRYVIASDEALSPQITPFSGHRAAVRESDQVETPPPASLPRGRDRARVSLR